MTCQDHVEWSRSSRAQRSRVDDTIIGLAAGHSGHAHPPACVPDGFPETAHSVHAQRSRVEETDLIPAADEGSRAHPSTPTASAPRAPASGPPSPFCDQSILLPESRAPAWHVRKTLFPGAFWVHAGCGCVRAVPACGVWGAAWVRGGSLGSVMRAGRRCLSQRVGGVRWSGSLPGTRTRVLVTLAGTCRAGHLCVFPQCGVGHASALGLVRRPVAISGLLLWSLLGRTAAAACGADTVRKGS